MTLRKLAVLLKKIGYPVMLEASSRGGGGKGFARKTRRPRFSRERPLVKAKASGNGAMYIERRLSGQLV